MTCTRVIALAVVAIVGLIVASCGGLVFGDDVGLDAAPDGSLRPGIYCDKQHGVIHPDAGLNYYSQVELCQGDTICTSAPNGGNGGFYCGASDRTPHPHCIKPCEANTLCNLCTLDDAGCPDACQGGCTNFLNDPTSCGACGHSCKGGWQCAQGVCMP